jgi:antitoxin (DNA-binding transcriptional repressor) of toxin-antitoxin stability system
MKQATFTEVRNHAKQYFDIVESGESVRVIRNGKPIADYSGVGQCAFMEAT